MSKKKTTTKKKASKKKATTKTNKKDDEIPAPLGAKAPDLNERAPVNKKGPKQPPYNEAFQAVCALPGLSAKQKSQVKGVMEANWGKNKTVFIESVLNIKGLKQKKAAIERALAEVM